MPVKRNRLTLYDCANELLGWTDKKATESQRHRMHDLMMSAAEVVAAARHLADAHSQVIRGSRVDRLKRMLRNYDKTADQPKRKTNA